MACRCQRRRRLTHTSGFRGAPIIDVSKVYSHQGYELLCGARPVDSGRFAPTLTVRKLVWPTRTREIAVPRGTHSDPASAIEAARLQGIEWVLNYA